ncbi:MAG TPA: helix-turn-helix domain-containing protein [Verrucomicrobiae bacterium]|nr:helix-turn-helix domain-containing protein [Verrucomicrobiae bacterium]
MRVSREQAETNRAAIVTAASRLFREKGFDGVGVDAIMQAAGLTHGGFYRNFASKDALAAEAIDRAFAGASRDATSIRDYAARYLTPKHRDNPAAGCTFAALAGDVAREGKAVRHTFTQHVEAYLDRFVGWMEGRTAAVRRKQAINALAGLVGALTLARAVDDPELSDEILAAARSAYGVR